MRTTEVTNNGNNAISREYEPSDIELSRENERLGAIAMMFLSVYDADKVIEVIGDVAKEIEDNETEKWQTLYDIAGMFKQFKGA